MKKLHDSCITNVIPAEEPGSCQVNLGSACCAQDRDDKHHNFRNIHKKNQNGFTLIELMVVMLIIGISMGVVGISVNSLRVGNDLKTFTDRLYQKVNLYNQEAMLSQREIGLSFFENKIEILSYKYSQANNVWTKTKEIEVPSNIQLRLKINEADLFLTNLSRNQQQLSADLYNNNNAPEVIFSSGGQISPFSLLISSSDEDTSFVLRGEFSGEISMEVVNDKLY